MVHQDKNGGSWEKNKWKEVWTCPPLQQSVSCNFTLGRKKSGNWQPVILWLSDHELLMGTLVPLSLGTGIFCYFKGPSFSLSQAVAVTEIWISQHERYFCKNGQFPRTWIPSYYFLYSVGVYVCVYMCVRPIRWALTGPVVSIRPGIQLSQFSLMICWDWLACSCHSLHRSPATRACLACCFSPAGGWEGKRVAEKNVSYCEFERRCDRIPPNTTTVLLMFNWSCENKARIYMRAGAPGWIKWQRWEDVTELSRERKNNGASGIYLI